MSILGGLIAIGAALAFGAVAVFIVWGSWIALQREIANGFVSAPASSGAGRALTVIGLWGPLLAAAILSLLGAFSFLQIGFAGLIPG